MLISGSHAIIYSQEPELDRVFFRDVLGFPSVDAGEGWLVFGLPESELAIHDSEKNNVHEFYLITDDIHGFVDKMKEHGIKCTRVKDRGYGLFTKTRLPGGGDLGVYEPRHARPTHAKSNRERFKTRRKKQS